MLLAWQKKGYIFWPQNTADKLQQPGSGWLSYIKNEVAKSCWMNKKANSSLTLNKKNLSQIQKNVKDIGYQKIYHCIMLFFNKCP